MNRRAALLALCPALLITGCVQHALPPVATTPSGPTIPAVPEPSAAPIPTRSPLNNLGLLDVTFSGLQDPAGPTVTAHPALNAAGLTDQGSVQLKLVSNGTFTTGTRGAGGTRYLYATFQVRNANASGAAYATPRQNLTLVAVSTPTTIGDSPVSKLQRFDGTDASASVAASILPTTGLQLNRQTQQPELMPGGQDLQAYAESEVGTLTGGGVTRAFPYGFVVRHRTQTTTRTLAANPATGTYDGVVTIAVKVPLQATAAEDPYSFNMTFAAVDDSVTRVTESPEEQALGTVSARATPLNAQVAVLCGSTYSASPIFIGSVTTAGAPGTRTAHIGGDVALKTLPAAYAATGNATLNVNAAAGLASAYSVYPPTPGGATPTLTFTGSGTARGGTLGMNGDGSFAFTSKAGDGSGFTLTRNAGDTFAFSGGVATPDTLRYALSTSTGCASPTQTAPVNVAGRVWFVDNTKTGGDGRQTGPFTTVSAAQSAAAANDLIYLAGGTGTYTQSAPLALQNAQAVVGAGKALIVGSTTLAAAGTAPTLQVTSGAAVTLSTNNTLTGLGVQGNTDGITGTNFGTFNGTLTQIKASNGLALNLKNGAVNLTTTRLDATNAVTNGRGANLEQVGGTFTVSGNSAAGSGGQIQTATATGNIGIHLQPDAANLTVNLNRMTIQGNHTGVQFTPFALGSAGTLNLSVQDSVFQNNSSASVYLNPTGNTSNTYLIRNNTFTHSGAGTNTGIGIAYEAARPAGSASVDQGKIQGNTLSMAADGNANAIDLAQRVAGAGRFEISGNTISSFGLYGMQLRAMDGAARLDVILTNNNVSSPAGPSTSPNADGIYLTSGITSGQTNTLCVRPTGNTSSSPTAGNAGFALRQLGGSTFIIDTAAPSAAGVQAANNNSSTRVRNTTTFSPVAGTCQAPN